jgi:N-acetylglucosaminyldiphosphoundecaprenol N-acetyl-beta-D-mannosaminyltransferase
MDSQIPVIELDGVAIARLTRAQTVDRVFHSLAAGRGGWVLTVNVDLMQRFAADPSTRESHRMADLVVADGVPLMWAARLQGTPLPERVAGSDLTWHLAQRANEAGRSLYLMGGEPGAAEGAAVQLRARWPGLRVAGIASPRVSVQPTPDEIAAIGAELDRARPDLVYVALGSPKTERLIAALRPGRAGIWWIGVGISLSFAAGQIKRAPLWMQRCGLEWLHRLHQEPGRLARRYFRDDLPYLIGLLWRVHRRRISGARMRDA